ncbi:GbsR/MarR family transcriptional regulator [Halioxenophilus aromaticivorans]|uniref:HTH-type transcriptional regulator n=1 Tax=Halioxenophilus aromaticivorans TaxID=1306992 RepID=A0AAV3U3T3_9ALTE
MSNDNLNEAEMQFVNAFSALLAPWGLAPATGKVLGFLFLKQKPVSVDEIAGALKMSRVGAWNSAKGLEAFGHIRSTTLSGTKKVLYSPSSDYSAVLVQQAQLIGSVGNLLRNCAENIAEDSEAMDALSKRAHVYTALCHSMITKLEELMAEVSKG